MGSLVVLVGPSAVTVPIGVLPIVAVDPAGVLVLVSEVAVPGSTAVAATPGVEACTGVGELGGALLAAVADAVPTVAAPAEDVTLLPNLRADAASPENGEAFGFSGVVAVTGPPVVVAEVGEVETAGAVANESFDPVAGAGGGAAAGVGVALSCTLPGSMTPRSAARFAADRASASAAAARLTALDRTATVFSPEARSIPSSASILAVEGDGTGGFGLATEDFAAGPAGTDPEAAADPGAGTPGFLVVVSSGTEVTEMSLAGLVVAGALSELGFRTTVGSAAPGGIPAELAGVLVADSV